MKANGELASRGSPDKTALKMDAEEFIKMCLKHFFVFQ